MKKVVAVLIVGFSGLNAFAMTSPYWRSVSQLEALFKEEDVQNIPGRIQKVDLEWEGEFLFGKVKADKCNLEALIEAEASYGQVGAPGFIVTDIEADKSCYDSNDGSDGVRAPVNHEIVRQLIYVIQSEASSKENASAITSLKFVGNLMVEVKSQYCTTTIKLTPKRGTAGTVDYKAERTSKLLCQNR